MMWLELTGPIQLPSIYSLTKFEALFIIFSFPFFLGGEGGFVYSNCIFFCFLKRKKKRKKKEKTRAKEGSFKTN